MASSTDLQTTIKNVSGSSKYFGYLPPHGKTLADDATYTFDGDIMDYLNGPMGNKRARDAYLADLNAQPRVIEVMSTPKPVITNPYAGTVVAVAAAPTVGAGASGVGVWTGDSALYFALTWTSPGIGETTIGAKSTLYTPGSNSDKAPSITVPTVPTSPSGVVANVYGSADGSTGWKKVLSSKAAGAHQFTDVWPPVTVVTPPTTNTLPVLSVAPPQSAVSVSGATTGGTIPAGTYKVAVTHNTIWGETSIGSSLSTTTTLTTNTSKITVTLPTVPTIPAESTVNVYITDTTMATSTLRQVTTGQASAGSYVITAFPALDATHPAPPALDTYAQQSGTQVLAANASGAVILVDPSWQK